MNDEQYHNQIVIRYFFLFILYRLIVVAEKDVVYKRFPIPLINRLEKHLLVMSTGLTEHQARLVKDLEKWVKFFSEAKHGLSLDTSRYTNYSLELQVVFKVDIKVTTAEHAMRSTITPTG